MYPKSSFPFAIKFENIKGKFVKPDKGWVTKFVKFCKDNNLGRKDWSIENDCVPKNCIESNGNIYMVDIDYKWIK